MTGRNTVGKIRRFGTLFRSHPQARHWVMMQGNIVEKYDVSGYSFDHILRVDIGL